MKLNRLTLSNEVEGKFPSSCNWKSITKRPFYHKNLYTVIKFAIHCSGVKVKKGGKRRHMNHRGVFIGFLYEALSAAYFMAYNVEW